MYEIIYILKGLIFINILSKNQGIKNLDFFLKVCYSIKEFIFWINQNEIPSCCFVVKNSRISPKGGKLKYGKL